MTNDSPIPRDGKVEDYKLVTGTRATGSREEPDACPFCGEQASPIPGAMLGQVSIGETINPEPWQETGDCAKCGASLVRIPGDPWIGTAP